MVPGRCPGFGVGAEPWREETNEANMQVVGMTAYLRNRHPN